MALVDSVDYPGKRIYLGADSLAIAAAFDVMLVYQAVRSLRAITPAHQNFLPIIFGEGRVAKGAGTFTQKYVRLEDSVYIVPANSSHKLRIITEIFSSEPNPNDVRQGRDCFDRDPLSSTVHVDIDYEVQKVEIVTVEVNTGSGLTTAQNDHLLSLGTPQQNADTLLATELP